MVGGIGFACDVSQADEVQKMVDRVEAEVGPIDLYCSNAGVLERDLDFDNAASAPDSAWTRSWNINVMGHVHAARALLPYWKKRQAGYFLATVSAAGLLTQVGSGPYSATEHGPGLLREPGDHAPGRRHPGLGALPPRRWRRR